jgi:hypothetical protein
LEQCTAKGYRQGVETWTDSLRKAQDRLDSNVIPMKRDRAG